jgi:hypothetical protein
MMTQDLHLNHLQEAFLEQDKSVVLGPDFKAVLI